MTVRLLSAGFGAILLASSGSLITADPTPTPAWVQSQESTDAFMAKFRRALKIQATDELTALVRQYESEAVRSIAAICTSIGEGSSEQLEIEMEGLRRAWSNAFGTRFPSKYYEYHSLMRAPIRAQRNIVMESFGKKHTAITKAFREQQFQDLPRFALELDQIASTLSQLGDGYYASEAWRLAAIATDEHTVGKRGDLEMTVANYTRALKARKKIGLTDSRYNECFERHAILVSQGYTGESVAQAGDDGKAESKKKKKEAEKAKPIKVAMEFAPLESIDSVPRPVYGSDPIFPAWTWVALEEEGSAKLFGIGDDAVSVIRTGASVVMVDQDRDGKGDVRIPITGNVERVDVQIGSGSSKRGWALFAAVGDDVTPYQSFQINLAPTPDFLNVYVAGAGAVEGVLEGVDVRVIDDNMDGIYGSYPLTWTLPGLMDEKRELIPDSMLIGSAKRAVPWSEYQKIGKSWYRLSIEEGGSVFFAEPTEVETGRVRLDFKGGKPDFVVIQGTSEKWGACYFDVAAGGKKGIEVPLGKYRVVSGRFSKGKGLQMAKALIRGGENPPEVVVTSEKVATLEMGAPFGFDFNFEARREGVTVIGQSVSVTGRGGEYYDRLWNVGLEPDASMRARGAKRGGKPKRMPMITDQLHPKMFEGWNFAWRPLDVELPRVNLASDAPVEVQLTLKKNKLFGSKLASEWKE